MTQQISVSYENLASIILKELNKFRNYPQGLLSILEDRLQSFDINNNYLYRKDKNIRIGTEEGPSPLKQLMSLLPSVGRLNKLNWSFQLHCIANYRAKTLSKNSELQANGPKHNQNVINGMQTLDELVSRQLKYEGQISEHFLYGFCDPMDIILQLIIDDGIPGRQNRHQLINPKMKHIGIGIHEHHKYMFVIVLIMAAEIGAKTFHHQQVHQNYHHPIFPGGVNPQNMTNVLQQHGESGCGSRVCSIF